MKAITLTYDNNQFIADHAIARYSVIWPSNPFEFYVPYQSKKTISSDRNVVYIESPVPICDTVLTLLKDVDEEEWVFWSMDDYFPISFNLEWVRKVIGRLDADVFSDWSGVNFCASAKAQRLWRNKLVKDGQGVSVDGDTYLELGNYGQIWVPQFLRAKVLRNFFEQMPNPKIGAKEMDELKTKIKKPDEHRLLLSASDQAVYSESTRRGVVTADFVKSAAEAGIPIDDGWLSKGVVGSRRRGRVGFRDRIEKIFNL